MEFVQMLRKAAQDKADKDGTEPGQTLYWDAANELVMQGRALEYAYRIVNFGFEYGKFDMSVLRQRAKEYFENFPEGQF